MYKKSITGIAIAAMMAASLPAFAGGNSNNSDTIAQGGTGNGYGGNGYGGAGGSASAGAVGIGIAAGGAGGNGGSGGAGGAGGQGGAGGSVVGSGNSSATGGAVVGSGNSTQGQQQGQAQSSKNANRNDNRSSASASNSGNNAAQQVNVGGDHYEAARIPVATAAAWAAPATAPCYATWGAGVQTAVVGGSVSGGTKDQDCSTMEVARRADLMGEKEIAREVMCDLTQYRAARARRGDPCEADKPKATTVAVAVAPEERDPIKRYRAGLPPLQ